MPLYEYICNDCKKLFTEVLTIKEHETRKISCPNCHGRKVEKVVEPVNALTGRKSGSR